MGPPKLRFVEMIADGDDFVIRKTWLICVPVVELTFQLQLRADRRHKGKPAGTLWRRCFADSSL